jgi:hypothetical protein
MRPTCADGFYTFVARKKEIVQRSLSSRNSHACSSALAPRRAAHQSSTKASASLSPQLTAHTVSSPRRRRTRTRL